MRYSQLLLIGSNIIRQSHSLFHSSVTLALCLITSFYSPKYLFFLSTLYIGKIANVCNFKQA